MNAAAKALSRHHGEHESRITPVFFAVMVGMALLGSATANWGAQPALVPVDVWPYVKFVAAAILELSGVVLAYNADRRRLLGEKAIAWRLASAAVAGLAITVQLFGHADEAILAGVFAGFSLLGYGVYLFRSGDKRRDRLRAEGKLPPTAPDYPLSQWLAEPAITRRAKALALEYSLDLYGSLAAAREERRLKLEEEQQRQDGLALAEALAAHLVADEVDPSQRAIRLATYNLPYIVERMRAAADNDGVADALMARMTTRRVAGGHAPRPRTNRAPRGASGDAPEGDSSRASRRASGTRTRRIERAGGWWTEHQRERIYVKYADRIDAGQGEMTGEEMREALGAESRESARTMRDRHCRTRYANEYLKGTRKLHDGVALPDGIARIIAQRSARDLHTELDAVSASTDAPDSAS